MAQQNLAVVVLAAGLGTRMKSARPKVLHELAGRPMLGYIFETLAALAPERPERVVVVAGPGMERALEGLAAGTGLRHETVVQSERMGTGHAVACAKAALGDYQGPDGAGDVLVVFGDTPFLRPQTLRAMIAARRAPGAPDLLTLAFRPTDPAQYGRVVVDEDGQVLRVVEHADASEAERAIGLCNAGVLLGEGAVLVSLVDRLRPDNAKGEFYLTDVYALAHAEGRRVRVLEANPEEVLGINSRAELAAAEAVVQARLRARAMAEGATLVDPGCVWLAWDTRLGRDVTVEPNVRFGPGVVVGDEVTIHSFCHLAGARVEAGAVIGPFARLRPGTVVGPKARVGNFVEVKNAVLGAGAKANHLSYLGDAQVGAEANVGAGTITCNYDGIAKHRTTIGRGAFIGSNTALVAPVCVGEGAIVGAGSTITRDVAAEALAVARAEQREQPGAARRFRARRRSRSAEPARPEEKKRKDA